MKKGTAEKSSNTSPKTMKASEPTGFDMEPEKKKAIANLLRKRGYPSLARQIDN